jgi:hypothetical protein
MHLIGTVLGSPGKPSASGASSPDPILELLAAGESSSDPVAEDLTVSATLELLASGEVDVSASPNVE